MSSFATSSSWRCCSAARWALGKKPRLPERYAARPIRLIVVTLGERGALAVVGDDVIEQPAFRVEVVDSTGAGDAFVAGFSVALGSESASPRCGSAAPRARWQPRGAEHNPRMPTLDVVNALLGA